MRKIKFRAWDEKNKCYYKGEEQHPLCPPVRLKSSAILEFACLNSVDPEQFIGQSDANGIEIFDGDIVLCIAGWRRD